MNNKMIENDIIEDKRRFNITKKGEEFLKEFNKIKIFSDSYGL